MKFITILFLLLPIIATAQTTKTISNRALDQDLKVCVNDGGVEKCPVEIDGATGKFKGVDGLATATSPGLVTKLGDFISVYNSADQTFTGSAAAVYNTESFDLTSAFTANAYTVKSAGYYRITVSGNSRITVASGSAASGFIIRPRIGGGAIHAKGAIVPTYGEIQVYTPYSYTTIALLSVNDVIDVLFQINGGSPTIVTRGNILNIEFIR